jgi:hypothetical protein
VSWGSLTDCAIEKHFFVKNFSFCRPLAGLAGLADCFLFVEKCELTGGLTILEASLLLELLNKKRCRWFWQQVWETVNPTTTTTTVYRPREERRARGVRREAATVARYCTAHDSTRRVRARYESVRGTK